jgi:hypothetical protein
VNWRAFWGFWLCVVLLIVAGFLMAVAMSTGPIGAGIGMFVLFLAAALLVGYISR